VRSSVDVHNYLVERDIQHELLSVKGRLRTPDRMAAVLDLPPETVGRVVIFEGHQGPIAAIVPSDGEADPVRVSKAAHEPTVDAADEPRSSELTGYLPESIPPVGLPDEFRIVLDESLHRDEVLYFPGGEPRAVLKVRGTDLARATGATLAAIVFHWPGE
jgi:prolyl-tRNA editing enzyme YbaK/EbsC (Cys-tRNA(Pro) deacylase)